MLRSVQEVRLEGDSAVTMAVDGEGRWWLGQPGAVLVLDSAGGMRRIPLSVADAPRVVGWLGSRAYLRRGDGVVMVETGTDSVAAERAGFGRARVLTDDDGEVLFQGAASGAVLEHDAETLEPLAGWASLGQPTTALAESPEGDRLYQALGAGEGEGGDRLLIRDRQTGRILGEESLDEPLAALATDAEGTLYGLTRSGRRVTVVALRPAGEGMERLWERRLRGRVEEGELRLEVRDGRIVVGTPPPAPGVRVLDAQDGEVIGRAAGRPLDFDLAPDGALWALYPGVLRRLR